MSSTIGELTARLTLQRETLVSGDWLKTSGDRAIPLAGTSLADLPIDSHTRWVIEMSDETSTAVVPVEAEPAAETDEPAPAGDVAEAPAAPSRKSKAV